MNLTKQALNMKEISEDKYTEDDTFRVLARPDIHTMVKLHQQYKVNCRRGQPDQPYPSTKNISFCKYYGWDWVEFLIAKKEAGYSY
jgi:hypothetical protein